MSESTIFAPATPIGRSAVTVVRVSGPGAAAAAAALCGKVPSPRKAHLIGVRHPGSGELIDKALVLFFAAPASATGEDVLELHLHGGVGVAAAALDALSGLPGFRPAEPGEFTRRALLAGKMDLPAVEGLGALLEAETGAQRRQALRQMDGVLGRAAAEWRARLLQARALMEAAIDFSDESEVTDFTAAVRVEMADVQAAITAALAGAAQGERLRSGTVIVVAGPPNAGKSSLLNALARREAAIVTPRAGTTRDPIEVRLDLGGYPAVLVDTAGLRDTADEVEAEGIHRAHARIGGADLVLWVVAPGCEAEPEPSSGPKRWLIRNKADLDPGATEGWLSGFARRLTISCLTGEGLENLRAALAEEMRQEVGAGETALVVQARQRLALEDAAASLARGATAPLPELLAEELRAASESIGRLTGAVGTEEVLDALFSRFCIGK